MVSAVEFCLDIDWSVGFTIDSWRNLGITTIACFCYPGSVFVNLDYRIFNLDCLVKIQVGGYGW